MNLLDSVERFLFRLCLVFGVYSAVAALVAVAAGEASAAVWYAGAAAACLLGVPALRLLLFGLVGITDEPADSDEEHDR